MRDIITFGYFQIADLGLHKNQGMELTYITKGRMEWVVDGRVEVVQQGDVFFTLPWQLHGSPVMEQPENAAYHLLFKLPGRLRGPRAQFQFPGALGFSERESLRLSRIFSKTSRHAWPASNRIKAAFPWMIEEMKSRDSLRQKNSYGLLRSILIEMVRIFEQEPRAGRSSLDSEVRVKTFLETLKEKCDEEWSLLEMSSACGVQRTRFSNLVYRLTGYTPMIYLMRVRIDKARDLLRHQNYSITDVAMLCGFSSSQYFANVFRKCVGLSPTSYRDRFPELYNLEMSAASVPWRTLEEERNRVLSFQEG